MQETFIDRIEVRPTKRRTSRDMVDIVYYKHQGDGPCILANYVSRHVADELVRLHGLAKQSIRGSKK